MYGPVLYLRRGMTNNYTKPFLSIAKQIDVLKSRGMLIENDEIAASYLETIGYYRLSGYWFNFRKRDKNDPSIVLEEFVPETKFTDAVNLYVFDRKLRLLFMDAIERVEVALRVRAASVMGGRSPLVHLDGKYLNNWFTAKGKQGESHHSRWTQKLDRAIDRSKEHFVSNYKNKYDSPLPIWIAIELWDFGLTSFFISGLKAKDQTKIANHFDIPRNVLLTSWVRSINYARNVCAHHARLWNSVPADQPKLIKAGEIAELEHLLTNKNAQIRIYAQAALIQYFMKRINPTSTWGERMKELLNEFPETPGLSVGNMGFPKDWQNLDLWR